MAEGGSISWCSRESTEKLIALLEEYKKRVAWCQSEIEDYKELLSRATNSEDKEHYEWCIKYHNDAMTSFNDSIQQTKMELRTRAFNPDDVMENIVKRKECSSLIAGGGGVGKTHLVALLMKWPPPSKRVSTSCAEVPPWLMKCLQVQKNLTGIIQLSDEMHTALIMKFGLSTELDLVQKFDSDLSITSTQNLQNTIENEAKMTYSMLKDVDLHFHKSKWLMNEFEKTDCQIFGRLVDIGGQPQLLELLPRFVSNITLGAVVIDLSQGLDKYPVSYFYGKDGKSVGKGIRSNLTNEQIMRIFLLMIASLCTEQKKVKIIIIGTHRDVAWKCLESRQTKEDKIKAIISSFKLEENIIYKTKSSLIFDVNAKSPKDSDRTTAMKIIEIMMSEEYAVEVSIPLKHHKLEITAQMLLRSDRIAISFDELYCNMSSYYDSPSAMTKGLEFLNKSFRLFYFKEFPKLVFGPQKLLNLMTEITVYHIKLTTNPDQAEVCDGMWNQFKEQAIVNEKILKKISKCYDHNFTAKQMLEVMEKLSITCKLQEDKYLMPSLLTALATLPQSQSSRWKWFPFGLGSYLQKFISGMESDITMLAHFPGSMSKFGVYCGTVCKLITDYHWELFGEVSRNRFQFTQPNNLGIISLVDSFDSFFIINLDKIPSNFSSEKLALLCSKTSQTIFCAIKQVTANLGYTAKDPEVAFLCDHDSSYPHVAEYLHESDCLRCIKIKEYTKHLTPKNKLWLQRNFMSYTKDLLSSEATHMQVLSSTPTQVLSSSNRDLSTSDASHTQALSSDSNYLSESASGHTSTLPSASLVTGTRTELKDYHYSEIVQQLMPVKTDWETIAINLGFMASEIKAIRSRLNRIVDQNYIYDVIEYWFRWAPGDERGSKDVATLEMLEVALRKANHSNIKVNIREHK